MAFPTLSRRFAIALVAFALIGAACSGGDRTVQEGDPISVHYLLTLDDGTEFDSSRTRGVPFSLVVGSGGSIPGFDSALRGMKVGDVKTVRISARDAYGEWSPENSIAVPIERVPADVVVGDVLTDPSGRSYSVIAVSDTEVLLDNNHELAGRDLTFEIELVSFDD